MFSGIRKRVTYTNVAMTVALVFAMSGGAYAAKKYVISSTKQISPSVLKQLKGAAGKQGPAGPQGPAGVQGPAGAAGKEGAAGGAGKEGVAGKSAVVAAAAKGVGNCKEGGASVEVEGSGAKSYVCNGEKGKDGSPWTAGGTLPAGASEHGQWIITGSEISGITQKGRSSTGISFPVPLSSPLLEANAHVIQFEEGAGEAKPSPAIVAKECTGTWESPGAASGNLCLFVSPTQVGSIAQGPTITDAESEGVFSVGVSGAVIIIEHAGEEGYLRQGSWVVTG